MRTIGVLTAAALLLFGSLTQAQEPRPVPIAPSQEAVHYGWADVLRVDPIYDDAGPVPASASAPHEECYEEQIEQPAAPPDNRAGNTVLGAIIGGVIGHQFGKGSGRAATTVAGAAAGAAIGSSASQGTDRGYATERHCRMVDSNSGSRHVIGYDVEYRYRGERYTSRMNYDPGERIRVRISVTPAE